MLLWFWYCKWRILADNSFAMGYERYEINSVNKVYRATQFLIQKVAIDVQRGNAASVMATIPSSQDWAEFASLPTV